MFEISTVEDLSQGRLATDPKKNRTSFTILIVGETGVGKTSVLNMFYNVLSGNGPYNLKSINDEENEGSKSQLQSQTESAKSYTFTSKNGVDFTIIDTPGLNDTRGGDYDERHKGSIAKVIEESVTSLNAVLILANGTFARLSAGTEYALNALVEIFPKELQNNIAVLFTNCASLANLDCEYGGLPPALANAAQYTLENPFALQTRIQKRRKGKPDPDLNSLDAAKQKKAQLKEERLRRDEDQTLERAHSNALEMIANFLNQVLENTPQGTRGLIDLRNKAIALDIQIASATSLLRDLGQKQHDLIRFIKEIEAYGKLSDNESKSGTLRAQKVHLEQQKTCLEASFGKTLIDIATTADQWSAMSLTGDFVGGVNRSINLLEVQRRYMAQKDPDTAQRLQQMVDVLKNKKAVLEAALWLYYLLVDFCGNVIVETTEEGLGINTPFQRDATMEGGYPRSECLLQTTPTLFWDLEP
ncbi:hypothetical protein DL93DRAFT_2171529 [Clavulina sp. PMI_390]|nr:hypothetical protein DL93DRAFT_2171529 [Clavulina sp. PMI_390]